MNDKTRSRLGNFAAGNSRGVEKLTALCVLGICESVDGLAEALSSRPDRSTGMQIPEPRVSQEDLRSRTDSLRAELDDLGAEDEPSYDEVRIRRMVAAARAELEALGADIVGDAEELARQQDAQRELRMLVFQGLLERASGRGMG